VINSFDEGSNNPYIMYGTGANSYATVAAVFDQDFVPNPPLQNLVQNLPLQYDTINVNANGGGRLYWTSSYGAVYDSGWTDTSASIAVPHGATVSFTAVPMNGNQFNNWMINTANEGSINPYVVHSTADDCCRPATVVAVFAQA
jgi:hypothetical protein